MAAFQIDRRSIANFDIWLLLLVIIINVLGIINLSSAAVDTGLWKTQLYWFLLGLPLMAAVLLIDYKRYENLAPLFYIVSMAALVGVHFFGYRVGGSRSWYNFGFAHFQPSELVKISMILMFARIYSRDTQGQPWGLRDLAWPAMISIPPVIAILMEPDMGTAMIVTLLVTTMTLFAGVRGKILLVVGIMLLTLIASYPLWKRALKPHQQARIEVFIHPEKDPSGAGYHVLQSKIAIGSGGPWGKGFRKGNVHMLSFLPAQQTDFVFSVWAEEWGLVWVAAVLGLYTAVIWRGLGAAQQAKDRFGVMIAVGASALLFWHIFINISMLVGIFPVIGAPLPFMSYGGSNLMTFMAAAALIMNVRMRKYFF